MKKGLRTTILNWAGRALALGVLAGCVTSSPLRSHSMPCFNALRDGGSSAVIPASKESPTVVVQSGHSSMVKNIAITPDGRYAVVSELAPPRIKLWDIEAGREVLTYPFQEVSLSGVHVSADGRRVLADSLMRGLYVFDLASGAPLLACEDELGASIRSNINGLSPDGRFVSALDFSQVNFIKNSGKLEIWDRSTGEKAATFDLPLGMQSVFAPDSEAVLFTDGPDHLRLVSLKSMSPLKTWRINGEISAITFSSDGAKVFAASKEGALWVFDRKSGAMLAEGVSLGEGHFISALAAARDGHTLLVGDLLGAVGAWDLKARRWVKRFATAGRPAAALSPDGKHLFVATPRKLFLWRAADMRLVATWDPETDARAESAVYMPNGKQVALMRQSSKGLWVELIDLAQKRTLWKAPAVSFGIPSLLSIAPDGRTLFASYSVFEKDMMHAFTQVLDAATGRLVRNLSFGGPTLLADVMSSTWQSNAVGLAESRMAIVTRKISDGGTSKLRILETATGETVFEVEPEVMALALGASKDGRQVQLIGLDSENSGGVWSFDVKRKTFRRIGMTKSILMARIAFVGPNGQVMMGGEERPPETLNRKLYKMTPLIELQTGGSEEAEHLATQNLRWAGFSLDSQSLFWVGDDGFVHLAGADGAERLRIASFDDGEWVLMTPDGFFEASARGAQYIGVLSGNSSYAIDQFYERLYRPDLVMAAAVGNAGGSPEQRPGISLSAMLQQGPPPGVRIISPAAGELSKRDVEVEVEISDAGGGIGRIEWRINGAVVGLDGADGRGIKAKSAKPRQGPSRRETRVLTLAPGDNRIEVVAYNTDGGAFSTSAGLQLGLKDAISEPPSLHVLAIAINQYRDRSLRLSFAVPDAQALSASLQRSAKGVFAGVSITQLVDADATAEKIGAAFAGMATKVKSNDVFVLFVAGHGITQDGRYHFLPVDFRYTNESSIRERGINQDNLQQWMSSIAAKKSLVLLDTCNSGSFVQAQAVTRGIQEKTAIDKLTRATGRATIAASSDNQSALEGHQGHGVFTWAVLDAIGKADQEFGNRDGVLTTAELAAFVNDRVPDLTYKRWGYEQVPQVNLHGREFPIGISR